MGQGQSSGFPFRIIVLLPVVFGFGTVVNAQVQVNWICKLPCLNCIHTIILIEFLFDDKQIQIRNNTS